MIITRDQFTAALATFSGKERWDLHVCLLTRWQTLPISKRPPNYTEWLLLLPVADLVSAMPDGKCSMLNVQ